MEGAHAKGQYTLTLDNSDDSTGYGSEDTRPKASTAACGVAAPVGAVVPLPQFEGHVARCVGCLIGVMCGDVLGAPFEGYAHNQNSWHNIRQKHPEGVRDFKRVHYTDDTQMTIALAKSLVAVGRCDPEAAAQEYCREWEIGQHTDGYSGATIRVLTALQFGDADYRTSGLLEPTFGPDGSWANGGVMRIAPVGLAYRNAEADVLRRAVHDAVMCTHLHPQAVDAATIQAAAVGMLAKAGVSEPALDAPRQLVAHLLKLASTAEMLRRLQDIAAALETLPAGSDSDEQRGQVWEGMEGHPQWQYDQQLLDKVVSDRPIDQDDPAQERNLYWQIQAVDAVASALWALCRHWSHMEATIQAAVHYGGDADTVGAIAGALAGAQCGCAGLPQRWWTRLVQECTHELSGAQALEALAVHLAELDVRD